MYVLAKTMEYLTRRKRCKNSVMEEVYLVFTSFLNMLDLPLELSNFDHPVHTWCLSTLLIGVATPLPPKLLRVFARSGSVRRPPPHKAGLLVLLTLFLSRGKQVSENYQGMEDGVILDVGMLFLDLTRLGSRNWHFDKGQVQASIACYTHMVFSFIRFACFVCCRQTANLDHGQMIWIWMT